MWEMNEGGMKSLDTLPSSEKMMAMLDWEIDSGYRRRVGKRRRYSRFLCGVWKGYDERSRVGDVSIRGGHGALPRKACVVNDHMTQASTK